MNEKHYVSLKIAKQLHEAGIEFPESEKVWCNGQMVTVFIHTNVFVPFKDGKHRLRRRCQTDKGAQKKSLFAPSLSELLDELSGGVEAGWNHDKTGGFCGNWKRQQFFSTANTPPDATALMLLQIRGELGDGNDS